MIIEPRDSMLDLFDEYASAYVRGERPDVLAFVERAGAEAEAFARLVDAFLQAAPLLAADALDAARIDARIEGEPALLSLRKRLRLGLDEVAGRLGDALGLTGKAALLLERRYQQLELGQLDPAPVQERVWTGLRAVFGVDVRVLVGVPAPVPVSLKSPKAAFARKKESAEWARQLDLDQSALADALSPAPAAAPAPARDEASEIDRLFGLA